MSLEKLRERMRARISARNVTRWWDVRNADGDTAVLRIYDEIHWLFGVSAADFAEDLAQITAPKIEVQINSPGGDVFDGIAVYNALRAHPARVTTRVDGVAASIASVIAQAGDTRTMLTGTQMMVHEAWGVAMGPASEMREFADLLDRQTDVIAGIYAGRSGRKPDEYRGLMVAETWMTAEETVEQGLADEVVDPPRQEPQDSTRNDKHPKFSEHVEAVVTDLDELVARTEEVIAFRAEQGKEPLSSDALELFERMRASLNRVPAVAADASPNLIDLRAQLLRRRYPEA